MKVTAMFVMTLMSLGLFAGDDNSIKVGERITIQSKVMGEERTALVYLPQSYNGQASYPVLYMTDGGGHAFHTAGTIAFLANNQLAPEMIVVGVTNTNRTRDLTPTVREGRDASGEGGANTFLKFFTKELIPKIDKTYKTQPYRVFAGHSFGGIFAVNAFLQKPDAFDAFIAVSPSLWWDEEVLTTHAQNFFKKHKKLDNTILYLTMGGEGDRMLKPLAKFVDVLKSQDTKSFDWQQKIMMDEDHGSVVLRSHYWGLRHVFADWAPQRGMSFDDAKKHYKKLSKRMGYEIKVPEAMVNMMGYRAMGDDKHDDAMRIFKWNVENYPASANVYDSLGECQEGMGKLKDAHENYSEAYKRALLSGDANTALFKANMERVESKLKKAKS